MAPRKKSLHQEKHPFNAYPFEAFAFGSWQPAEVIKIKSGRVTLHSMDHHHEIALDKGFLDMRTRSSHPTFSDMRIRSRIATPSDCFSFLRTGIDVCVQSTFANANPVWSDAKISSIDRKPHTPECSCVYHVNFYVNQDSLASSEDKTLSKDCKVVGLNQIFILQKLGRKSHEDQPHKWEFSEDCITRLETRLSLGNFVSDITWLVATTSLLSNVSFCVRSVQNKILYQQIMETETVSAIDAINFIFQDGRLVPSIFQLGYSQSIVPVNDSQDGDTSIVELAPPCNDSGLRRSTRQSRQPERYLGYDPIGLSSARRTPLSSKMKYDQKFALVPKGGAKSNVQNVEKEHLEPLVVVLDPKKCGAGSAEHRNLHGSGGFSSQIGNIWRSQNNSDVGMCSNQPSRDAEVVGEGSSRHSYNLRSHKKDQRKESPTSDELMDDVEPKWEGINSKRSDERKRCRSNYSRNRNNGDDEERARRRKALDATASKQLIDSYMKDISKIPSSTEEVPLSQQWEEAINFGKEKETMVEEVEEEEELSETEMLWREMYGAITESFLQEQLEGSSAPTKEETSKTCEHNLILDEQIGIYCTRCGFVKTEIRYVTPTIMEHLSCRRNERQFYDEEPYPEGDDKPKGDGDDDDDDLAFPTPAACDVPISVENENVWKLVPELREKMHFHQKKAFEFLWENIAGSIDPKLMEARSERRGGCAISHAPGAGKTFLTIAFLISYLKLFPNKKPLILAPKTTLYTWYKEFIKWNIPVPVHLIHSRRGQRNFSGGDKTLALPGIPKPNEDVKHALDCLDKIQKWHANPSVLIMGYTSFLSFMNEGSKYKHKNYMAKALRESPGILILDEGHNPRSTKSRLRKGLMKVDTQLRILLSGTLFQNNFCEYFNTLCLARPRFVHEVLQELDPKYVKSEAEKKAPHLVESRARKFFMDKIGVKIDAGNDNIEEKMQGLNMLKKITSGFIDVYDSTSADSQLPGLQMYTLLMNNTEKQSEILQILQNKMNKGGGYPLQIEFLITLVSIHPWLITTTECAKKIFSLNQLKNLEKCKHDLKIGSKVKFLLSLVFRATKKEKVLIFCRNLAPMWLILELFEKSFNWKAGKEVLTLHGEQELFERGKVIDKFEDRGGASKVLLASISACAEGICLTAASRVIFLDSEWNPSKTKQAIARAFRPGQEKVVYVYQLLAAGSFEEDKYRKTNWKDWVSRMIFNEDFVENPSKWQAEKIEDETLREMAEEDKAKSIHQIVKNEKASTNL